MGAEGVWMEGWRDGREARKGKRRERALGRKGEHPARVRGELYEGGEE